MTQQSADVQTHSPAVAQPQPFYREEHYPEDAALVRRLSVKHLIILFDAMEMMNDAALAVMNQPRCDGEIHDEVEKFNDRYADVKGYIVEELKRRPMTGNKTDDEHVMGYVVAWELKSCGCHVTEAIATLAQMKVAHDTVRYERQQADLAASEAAERAA